ncbi:MAG: 1-(5-phosphoribosyl)-5-[(5-phosphoribosylamino)methylideneamino]imidazole-4-carboxamide isomerase [Acidimicrobiales bacterium]|nr:1-(5-phosphoribosyl)-5-[(5-phosphoribosylamino)methylideneamino]imidazole-4-carboxamide isomerase [Acidimicrobiales bacterium]
MDLYPAIDLRGGRCVRLYQGDYAQETVYADDPVAQARAFADAGAPWIHVVDLDGARSGEPAHTEVISAIAEAVDVPVQTGGGIRDEATAERLFAGGVARVVLGTVALEQPELVARLAARHPVAVGLDARAGDVAVRGWEEASGRSVLDVAREFEAAGIAALIVTDIGRDGTLEGPDVDGLGAVLAATSVDVIASGGVGTLADLEHLRALEVAERKLSGAIVGRALYEGAFTLDAALVASVGA